jgi:hypothetical protein
MRLLLGFIVVCVMVSEACGGGAGAVSVRVESEGETRLLGTVSGRETRILIRTVRDPSGEAPRNWPRTLTATPNRSRVQDIEIAIGSTTLFVPPSVFADLSDAREARLHLGRAYSILTLTGGDAAESYVVEIEFDGSRVRRRTLASALAPRKPTQETRYRLVDLEDETPSPPPRK